MHDNFTHAVLGPEGKPVAAGEIGELWIGGPCVGLGYYRQPEETQRRFVQDPRNSVYRAIMYRTGDLVREAADGNLWFVGRADNQVKIAGHRIELEEIDFAIQAHADVRRAVAVVAGEGDDRELVAVFEAGRPLASDELAAWTRGRLPAYMQPRRFVQVAELPRNANGKVDRIGSSSLASAPAPVADVEAPSQPSGGVEQTLRDIWAGVLNLSEVPSNANFFDLGGTSLLMIRVNTEIRRRLSRDIPASDLFAHPKIQDLVRLLGGAPERTIVDNAQQRGARQREMMQRMRRAASAGSQ
jgi:non-ribosomal peptide synthetase component F